MHASKRKDAVSFFSGVSEGSGKPPEGCSDTDCLSVVLPAAPAVRGTGELRGDSAD